MSGPALALPRKYYIMVARSMFEITRSKNFDELSPHKSQHPQVLLYECYSSASIMLISNPTLLFPTSDQVPTSATCKDPGHCAVIFIISNYLLDNVNDLTVSVPQYSERI